VQRIAFVGSSIMLCVMEVGLLGCPQSTRDPGPPAQPNVLLITLDTVRARVLSSYGNPKPSSPNVDRLASEGIRFTNVFATDHWTLPTHASLLTGEYPSDHHATSETNMLPRAADTLPERLRRVGYKTAAFVSNAWVSRRRGFAQGFHSYNESWRGAQTRDTHTLDRETVRAAKEWLAKTVKRRETPFFMFINLNGAHLPYVPEPLVLIELTTESRPVERVKRLKQVKGMWRYLGGTVKLDEFDFQIMREMYEAEVAMVDALVGELVEALRVHELLDDTLIIVTADHGENIGDHGRIDHTLSMHETTLHIPLVMRYSPRFAAGTVDDRLVSQVDVAPTILDIAGLAERYPEMVGRSLVNPDRLDRAFIIAENDRPINGIDVIGRLAPSFDTTTIDNRVRVLRTNSHKLIWTTDGDTQLFDIVADPGEENDISESQAELRDQLLAQLIEWMAERRVEEDPEVFESEDRETFKQLKALGYFH